MTLRLGHGDARQSARLVNDNAKKDSDDQCKKQKVTLYQMAHRRPIIVPRTRLRLAISRVELSDLILGKPSHLPAVVRCLRRHNK